ncbi:MAG TPA: hypothetical protein VEG66_00845 [Thermoplasmata archaeon]|nr:hypothetical protein [Thermoplasmata archaeon]
MVPEPVTPATLRPRLDSVLQRGRALEAEGLPFPTDNVAETFRQAVEEGELQAASDVLKRAEALLQRAGADWTWVKELLRRADELRAIAGAIGVDLDILDNRVGNPRKRLMAEPLSSGSLEKAAASASLALAVLNDAVPKFCVQEAQALGVSIRRARDRGEDVTEAVRSFSRLLQSIQDQNLATCAQRLVETRRTVARIPRAPALPPLSPREEEEILLEARNLARRLQRIKGKARDASSAARLMAQVRAAISEDRRGYGTPEEEIEQLWAEVDNLTRERNRAAAAAAAAAANPAPSPPARVTIGEPAAPIRRLTAPRTEAPPPVESPPSEEAEEEEGEEGHPRTVRPSFYSPYVPPEERDEESSDSDQYPSGARSRNRPRPRP